MSFYQNLFSEYLGIYTAGDSSSFKLSFKIPGNSNFTQPMVNWVDGPFDLSTYNTLTFNYAFDPTFKAWASFSVNIAGTSPAATTVYEVVSILNADTAFSAWYEAYVQPNSNRVAIRQKRPMIAFKTYISNDGAERVLKFNKMAGVADIPSYFDKDIIENRYAPLSNGCLIRLGKKITTNTAASPTEITSIGHGLTNGDTIYIVNSNCTPSIDGVQTVTVTGPDTFTIPVVVTIAGTSGEFLTDLEKDIVDAANLDYSTMLDDYEHLKGRCEAFMFAKNTIDVSNRVVVRITYAAGCIAGMLGKKTTYTYTGTNTVPDTVIEVPYILTNADLLVP
jgi:hypothetical protein